MLVGLIIFVFLFCGKVQAATLSSASDILSTSRPSASSPLSADTGSGASAIPIFNNGSRYLASDSAKIIRSSTNALINTGLNVASQSAALTTVNLSNTTGANSQSGTDVLLVPITAMHTVQFTTVNTVPVSGKIVLTYPMLVTGDATNPASASATTFEPNSLGSGSFKAFKDATDITANITIVTTNPSAGTSPLYTLTLDGATSITAGQVVKIFLGCSAGTSSGCSTQNPLMINPTKAAAAGTGDRWKLRVDTLDASSNSLDTITVALSTIDSVRVEATVDPTLTFTIAGLNNGTAVNNGNAVGCTNSETTDAGVNATATDVNLGILSNTPTAADTKVGNIAAQLLTVSTNGAGGYALTATSAGALQDTASGFGITSSTTPAAFPAAGTPWFGVHPCGLDVNGTTWTESNNQNCSTVVTGSAANECKYAWPTQTSGVTLSSDSSGPVGNSITAGNGLVSVEYAAGVDASVPAGNYQTVITYVATPTF